MHAGRGASPLQRGSSVLVTPRMTELLERNAVAGAGLPSVTRQELSELGEGHVLRDETSTATGEAVLRPLSNDVPARGYRLDVAPTAALLARRLDGDR
jgi:hypothetical protein